MRAILATLIFLMAQSTFALLAFDLDRYHSVEEINQYLEKLAVAYPELVNVHRIGVSHQGRNILVAEVGGAGSNAEYSIYLNAAHHGDEPITSECLLALLDYLVANKDEPKIMKLLSNVVFYIQPLVNPDGHVLEMRNTPSDHDPNRNYFFVRENEVGFTLSETQAVYKFMSNFKIDSALALHSGMEGVLWPWCDRPQSNPEESVFKKLSGVLADAMGFKKFMQSYFDYPSQGEFIDFAYNQFGIKALTVEVSEWHHPEAPYIKIISEKFIKGVFAFLDHDRVLDNHSNFLAPLLTLNFQQKSIY